MTLKDLTPTEVQKIKDLLQQCDNTVKSCSKTVDSKNEIITTQNKIIEDQTSELTKYKEESNSILRNPLFWGVVGFATGAIIFSRR